MPAEIVPAEFCGDYTARFEVPSSKKGVTYTVTWDMLGAMCTCPSFKFSGAKRHCKHCDEVWKKGCFWNPQWYDGGTRELTPVHRYGTPVGTCPACGGPTIAVRIAV